MSYIRSTSNPEHLYIFGSSHGLEIHYDFPGYPKWRSVSQKVWDTLCRRYVKDYEDVTEYKGLKVQQDVKIGEDFKTVLSYKDQWEIPMWAVTWESIVIRYRDDNRKWR